MNLKKFFLFLLHIYFSNVIVCMEEQPLPYILRTVSGSLLNAVLQEKVEEYGKRFYALSKNVRKNTIAEKTNIAQLVVHVLLKDDSVLSTPVVFKKIKKVMKILMDYFTLAVAKEDR